MHLHGFKVTLLAGAAALAIFVVEARAALRLPAIFSDHMVLQREKTVPIWGTAEPGETITVKFAGQEKTATADADGRWRVTLAPMSANAAPQDMTITSIPAPGPAASRSKIENSKSIIHNVLIGEVWLASGQSNMARSVRLCASREEIAGSANSRIRFFTVAHKTAASPLDDVPGKWAVASPENTPAFSAVAWYFARQMQAELNVPFGILHASWGGTPIQSWISLDALQTKEQLAKTATDQVGQVRAFPAAKAAWLETLRPWLASSQREERAASPETIATFATAPATAGHDGWTAVKLPGELPGDRILWVRREIDVPKNATAQRFVVDIDEIAGLDTVYFDGRRIGGRTWDTFGGFGYRRDKQRREYTVPSSLVKPGKHTLAVRIQAPLGETAVNAGHFTAGSRSLSGAWLAKTEHVYPPLNAAAAAAKPPRIEAPIRPWDVSSSLFNGMIHPLIPCALRGFLWYQGETNAREPDVYRVAMPLLINDWRARWGDTTLPFYWCQLPNFGAKTADANAEPGWAGIREAQTRALALPHTGQAVLIDVGEAGDIHPKSKREAGARLSAVALANTYGKNVPFAGPTYESMSVEGASVRIHFKDTKSRGSSLVARPLPEKYLHASSPRVVMRPLLPNSPGSQLEGFIIRGAPGDKWHWANARIDEATGTVLVSSPEVPRPQAVRYAWFRNPTCNLHNAAGFPAAPFRTDSDAD